MSSHIGFDIGGTFTDFALINSQDGALRIFKSLTTPDDPARGALNGMADLGRGGGGVLASLQSGKLQRYAWFVLIGIAAALLWSWRHV